MSSSGSESDSENEVAILSYQEAVAKGRNLSGLMQQPTSSIAQSVFTHSDLEACGYEEERFVARPSSMQRLLLANLTTGSLQPDFLSITHSHNKVVTVDEEERAPTWADFNSEIHTQAGILIACYNKGPAHMNVDPSVPLPSLRRWSDAAFLQWMCLQPENVQGIRNLRYIVREDITNANTKAVMMHIRSELPAANQQNLRWPGVMFPANSEQCMALLGTPNGVGVPWMLAQHRAQLGHKAVAGVVLFQHEATVDDLVEEGTWNLLFILRDVGAR